MFQKTLFILFELVDAHSSPEKKMLFEQRKLVSCYQNFWITDNLYVASTPFDTDNVIMTVAIKKAVAYASLLFSNIVSNFQYNASYVI